jgi:hypothetical protein
MALYKINNKSFNDVRLIIAVEGFKSDLHGFIIKELAVSSLNFNCVFHFNKSIRNLSLKDKKCANYLTNNHHYIDLFAKTDETFESSELSTVLKTVYIMCGQRNDSLNPTLIGYKDDTNALRIIYKAGLGHLACNLSSIFAQCLPSANDIHSTENIGYGKYAVCKIHNRHFGKGIHCAKARASLLWDFCVNYSKND